MLFSTETIMSSNFRSSFNNTQNDPKPDNNSIFIETLQFLLQENIEFQISMNNSKIDSINESIHASDVLKSLIKKIDFKKIIVNILTKFIELLEKMGKEVEVFFASLANQNTVIKRYKKQLQNFEKEVHFPDNRYIYTNLGVSTSYTTYKSELDKEYSTLILDLTELSKFNTYEGFYNTIQNITDECNMTESNIDELRGKVLGTLNPIKSEDFAKEAFNYFRNDGNQVGASNILPREVRKACDDFFNYSKQIKMVKKDKSDMKQNSLKIQKDISNLKLEDFIKDNLPPEANTYFAKLLNNKCIRVKSLCDIYLMLFSIKLDALKDAHNQNARILFEACKIIIREGEK